MSASMNLTVQAGNLTRDPELKFTTSGIPVCNFGIAVSNPFSKDENAVDFFDVTAWRKLGENVANYKSKGDPVLVKGRLQQDRWEAQDGSNRSKVSIVADEIQFLGQGGPRQDQGTSQSSERPARNVQNTVTDDDFEDIPF